MSRTALIDAEDEVWLDIDGYEGIYCVSNFGRIYSYPRTEYVKSKRTGGHYRFRGGRFIKFHKTNIGHLQAHLHRDGETKVFLVHRLVGKAFISNPNNHPEINHIDGNKTNNLSSNLEWVTRKENALHSTKVLCKNRGSSVGTSKLTENDVLVIYDMLDLGIRQKEIADQFNVTIFAINRINKDKNWSWLRSERKEVL
jgi:hypothetical protein